MNGRESTSLPKSKSPLQEGSFPSVAPTMSFRLPRTKRRTVCSPGIARQRT